MMDSIDALNAYVQQIIDEANQFINEEFVDRRAFTQFWITQGQAYLIIQKSDLKTALYYAGFEYIDDEHVQTYGQYVFFSSDDSRISDVIDSALYEDDE